MKFGNEFNGEIHKGEKLTTKCKLHGAATLNQCETHPDSGKCYKCHIQEHIQSD